MQAYTYTFDPAGPTLDGSGNIQNFTLGLAYTLTAGRMQTAVNRQSVAASR
jgi:hypothetical protein